MPETALRQPPQRDAPWPAVAYAYTIRRYRRAGLSADALLKNFEFRHADVQRKNAPPWSLDIRYWPFVVDYPGKLLTAVESMPGPDNKN